MYNEHFWLQVRGGGIDIFNLRWFVTSSRCHLYQVSWQNEQSVRVKNEIFRRMKLLRVIDVSQAAVSSATTSSAFSSVASFSLAIFSAETSMGSGASPVTQISFLVQQIYKCRPAMDRIIYSQQLQKYQGPILKNFLHPKTNLQTYPKA